MVTEKIKSLAKNVLFPIKDLAATGTIKHFPEAYWKLMELRDSRIKVIAENLDQDDPIILYFIGAHFGLNSKFAKYLRHKKLLFGIGFEPDYEEAQWLKNNNLFDVVLPYALGSEYGRKTLNITEHTGCSSILLPHTENLKEFCDKPEWFNVKQQVDIEVHRLDEIIQKEKLPAPDLLQIDTQGFEFEVLTGTKSILNQVSVIELEVQMYPLYYEQKMFTDIHHFMTENGFVLFLLAKAGVFGINYVEANACYFNKSLINKSKKSKFLIDYCSIVYKTNLLKVT